MPPPLTMFCRATLDKAEPNPDPAGQMPWALPSVDMVTMELRPMLDQTTVLLVLPPLSTLVKNLVWTLVPSGHQG